MKTVSEKLPYLQSDTENIVEYKNDIDEFVKKSKKRRFWDLLKN